MLGPGSFTAQTRVARVWGDLDPRAGGPRFEARAGGDLCGAVAHVLSVSAVEDKQESNKLASARGGGHACP